MMTRINIFARRFIARYLNSFVEFVYRIKFKFISFDRSPVIILTPGKVGSSSIYKTLKSELVNHVFHIHRLSERGIKRSVIEHLHSHRRSRPLHLIVSKLLREKLKKYDGNMYIITSIREPISRAVSAFFQNTEFHKSEIENSGLQIDKNKAYNLLRDELQSGITAEIKEWFDEEIKGNFDIDLFEYCSITEEGYKVLRKGGVHLLFLRMEEMDDNFEEGIKKLMHLDHEIVLKRANVGKNKFYANSYLEVKKSMKLDDQVIEEILKSKYVRCFYPDYAEQIKSRWG